MTDSILIRPFSIEDYPAVRTLWEVVGLPFKPGGRDSEETIRQESTGQTALFYVAEQNHQIIGVVFGTHDGRKGWINRLAVHPDYQHAGIARQLVDQVEAVLESRNIHIVACLIDDGNDSSVTFFKKMGYVPHHDIHYFCKKKNRNI